MQPDKFLQARCRNLLNDYQDVIEAVQKEVLDMIEKENITGDSAFSYAKKAIRKEAIKEGIIKFIQRINHHASER